MLEKNNNLNARELYENLPPESKKTALAAVEMICKTFAFSVELQEMLSKKEESINAESNND